MNRNTLKAVPGITGIEIIEDETLPVCNKKLVCIAAKKMRDFFNGQAPCPNSLEANGDDDEKASEIFDLCMNGKVYGEA